MAQRIFPFLSDNTSLSRITLELFKISKSEEFIVSVLLYLEKHTISYLREKVESHLKDTSDVLTAFNNVVYTIDLNSEVFEDKIPKIFFENYPEVIPTHFSVLDGNPGKIKKYLFWYYAITGKDPEIVEYCKKLLRFYLDFHENISAIFKYSEYADIRTFDTIDDVYNLAISEFLIDKLPIPYKEFYVKNYHET